MDRTEANQKAIRMCQAWARWELYRGAARSATGANDETSDAPKPPRTAGDYIASDQADHMTIDIQLKKLGAPHLRGLLLHVYGQQNAFSDTYDPLECLPPEERKMVKAWLSGYGMNPGAFSASMAKRFTKQIERILVQEPKVA